MEVFLKVFLITVLYNKVFGAQDLMAVEKSDSKIPAYIRDLILDYNKKNPNIHDVAILNLENESSEMILNQIIMEIPEENPVIIPTIDVILNDSLIRSTSFVIILSDLFNMVSEFVKFLLNDSYQWNFFLHPFERLIYTIKDNFVLNQITFTIQLRSYF